MILLKEIKRKKTRFKNHSLRKIKWPKKHKKAIIIQLLILVEGKLIIFNNKYIYIEILMNLQKI